MKKRKSKNNLYIKYGIIFSIVIVFIVLVVLIYNNIFASKTNHRFDGIDKHNVTTEEKNKVNEIFNEIDGIEKIDIYVTSKIINIYIKTDGDIDFKKMKNASKNVIDCFNNENLEFYDLQFFIESSNEESNLYPKIGYKHKSQKEIAW